MDSLQKLMKQKVLRFRTPNASAPRPYDNELIPAIEADDIDAEVKWNVYKGDFPWVPQVDMLKPNISGRTKKVDLNILEQENNAILFEGHLRVPADGEYTFYASTNGGVVLKIHEITAIDADHGYAKGSERQASLKLEEGLHPFRLYFVRTDENEKPWLNLEWSAPGMERMQIKFDSINQQLNNY